MRGEGRTGEVGEGEVGEREDRTGEGRGRGQAAPLQSVLHPTHIELSQAPGLPGCRASLQMVDVVQDGLLSKRVCHPQVLQVVLFQVQ